MLSEKGCFAVLELILICMGEDGKRSIRKCSQSCKGLPLNLVRVEDTGPRPGCSQVEFWSRRQRMLCYSSVYILVPCRKLLPHTNA